MTEFESTGIHEWLRRSKNCPLSFEVVHPFPDTHNCERALGTGALLSQTHRWKVVSLRQDGKCIDGILKVLQTPGKTPMLTEIRVPDMAPFYSYGPTPCARQISSFYIYSQVNPFSSDGRFRGLSELRISTATSQLYPSIFTQFPMLEILEIQICANFSPHGTATVVHSLPHLHTFIFGDDHSIETQLSLLDLFDTPALTYFAASIWTFVRNGSERTHLSNFLLRCGGQLQQLKLQGDWTLLGEIHGFIQHTPVLKSLCIAGVTFPEILTTVCPPLLQISVIVFLPVSECRPVTVDDIISQWNNTGLKTLARTTSSYTIRVPYWCPPELLKHRKLKKYIQQGLRIAMQRSHGGISVTTKQ